jgi:putrescine aminotransferase
MMHAVELVGDRDTRSPLAMDAALQDVIRRETGVIVRECAHNVVLSPPLIMSEDEAGEVVDAVRSVVERLQPDGSLAARP